MVFSEWLTAELEKRGWSRSEAARRGGISPSMFDKVINGHAKPGKKFADGLATAFDMSPVAIYRRAGLLPEGTDAVTYDDWKHLLQQLTPEEQEEIRQIAELKINLRNKSKALKALNPKKAG